ncbi:hypothetical protein RM780_26445 [Streptomyces sp. DSM 44917]|uniref:Uncharacterized protein n=1 Tax=Streptomyces boetiae TaxID=3075541 RepID=A0ABU2LFU8_9ACTN|nr:hypothetical protein [Streptomyces sp. DSM 44917]MDT0310461.1 hypothetical protein [Streptomyces sp. DSM 44917]
MRATVDHDRRAAIVYATAQLAELAGVPPRVICECGAVRIETEVTEHLRRRWAELLAVLDLGTAFGLTDTTTGQIAWLSFQAGESFRS